jgi:hypothetical protein
MLIASVSISVEIIFCCSYTQIREFIPAKYLVDISLIPVNSLIISYFLVVLLAEYNFILTLSISIFFTEVSMFGDEGKA